MFEKALKYLLHPKRSLVLVLVAILACALECFSPGFIFANSASCGDHYTECNLSVTGYAQPAWGTALLCMAIGLALYLHRLYNR